MQLGALTALALALSGCNMTSDDDDDCALGPTGGAETVALAMRVPTTVGAGRGAPEPATATVPERGGFGTHLASCGG